MDFQVCNIASQKKHNFALDWAKCKKNTKFYTKESVQYNGFFNVLSLVWNLVYHMYSDLSMFQNTIFLYWFWISWILMPYDQIHVEAVDFYNIEMFI